MINPKSLVSALHSHWEVMIALTTLSREYTYKRQLANRKTFMAGREPSHV